MSKDQANIVSIFFPESGKTKQLKFKRTSIKVRDDLQDLADNHVRELEAIQGQFPEEALEFVRRQEQDGADLQTIVEYSKVPEELRERVRSLKRQIDTETVKLIVESVKVFADYSSCSGEEKEYIEGEYDSDFWKEQDFVHLSDKNAFFRGAIGA